MSAPTTIHPAILRPLHELAGILEPVMGELAPAGGAAHA